MSRTATVLGPLAVAAAALAVHAGAAEQIRVRVASLGEAHLAAAAFAARGVAVGSIPMPVVDGFGARQIAVVETLLLPTTGQPVVDMARWACLAMGLLTVLLLWPVLRSLGVQLGTSMVAMAIVGVLPPALALHAGISTAAPAAVWLTAAAALSIGGRKGAVGAGIAVVLGVVTAPLAGAAVLALAAHLVGSRLVLRALPSPARLGLGAGLAVAAVLAAGAATGTGPLAGSGGPVIDTPYAVAAAAVGLTVVGIAWSRVRWLRPVLSPIALLLAVLVVPGPSRSTAALLVLPALAVVAGVVVEQLEMAVPVRRALRTAAAAALVIAVAISVIPAFGPTPPPGPSLVAWVGSELSAGTLVRADALDRAELVAGGFPPERLRESASPAQTGEVDVVSDRPSGGLPIPRRAGCAADGVLAAAARGSGGSPTVACIADGSVAASIDEERPRRARIGTALAGNRMLAVDPDAAAALRAGDVDPRLMLVLAAMAGTHRLAISGFPAAELDQPGAMRRRVLITAVDGRPATGDPLPLVRTWLDSQQPPFKPSAVAPVSTGLSVGYSLPAPAGLLPE